MIIISCQQVKKYHGAQVALENITMELHAGERAGLIGLNGSGKSTLLQLISGSSQPDEGQLAIKKGTRIGHLAQIQAGEDGGTVYDVLAAGYQELRECQGRMKAMEQQMQNMSDDHQLSDLLSRYADLQERFEREGGYGMEARIRQIAAGLGIRTDRFDHLFQSLSGGEKTKVALAALLIEQPDVLLLDEPTNHLDLHGVEWLEGFLNAYNGTCLIVSHDRYFLDRVVTRVIELEDGEAFLYAANYSGYIREKEARLLREFADYQEQQKKIRKMREAIKQLQEWGGIGGDKRFFTRAASMQRALERMEKLKRPVLDRKAAGFDWQSAGRSGRKVVFFEGICKGYGDRVVLEKAAGTLEYGEKLALVGANGSGKTTLFKLLMQETLPDSGELTLGAQVEVGYLAQEELPSTEKESVLAFFRREAALEEGEARGRLARYLFFGADVFKSVAALSGGEWTRLRLALLMERKPNLLLLDEPTNHLDIASREALEEALDDFPGTILAISHDRYFINKLAKRIWELKAGQITSYIGNFDDYKEKSSQRNALSQLDREPMKTGIPLGLTENEKKNQRKPAKQSEAIDRGQLEQGIHQQAIDRGQLEQGIHQLEEQLSMVDAQLSADSELNTDAAGSSTTELEAQWSKREAIRIELDRLYEAWMAGEE
ncbi:MAG: ABC-F family ATP-binding cassette domain-containing protein [Gorillibacterium sp.]|nr:ABC-F family ATP-binding cassette domain-containing protein [Gorillibacterium sp.]